MAECQLFKKDSIRLFCLKETVVDKSTVMSLYLESDGTERNFLVVRRLDTDSYSFNNFLVTENAADNSITFRPNVVGCPAYIKINCSDDMKIQVIRNGYDEAEETYQILSGEARINFIPENYTKYNLQVAQTKTVLKPEDIQNMSAVVDREVYTVTRDNEKLIQNITESKGVISELRNKNYKLIDEKNALDKEKQELDSSISDINTEIGNVNSEKEKLVDDKEKLRSKLEVLKAEYEKDYETFKDEAEEMRKAYGVDEEILALYLDKDFTPIEELIAKVKADMEQVEEQIRVFIDAKARKTAEIENELKIGKKD